MIKKSHDFKAVGKKCWFVNYVYFDITWPSPLVVTVNTWYPLVHYALHENYGKVIVVTFIYSSHRYLLSAYYVQDTILYIRASAMKKKKRRDGNPNFNEASIPVREDRQKTSIEK